MAEYKEKLADPDPVIDSPDNSKDVPSSVAEVKQINPNKELDAMVADMPEVVEDAVQAAEAKEAAKVQENQQTFDKKGRPFDPSRHATDKDGRAVLTPTGQFKKLTLPKAQPGAGSGTVAQPGVDGGAAQMAEIKACACMWADLFINFGISMFGDEWKPEITKGYNEREYLIAVNEAFMLENGVVKVPGWMAMLLAYGTYTVKRLNQPRTRTFFQGVVLKVRGFVFNAWNWLQGRKNAAAKVKSSAEGDK